MIMQDEITGFKDPRNFNNSICIHNGRILMAYRAEDPPNGVMAKIMIGELRALRINFVQQIDIPRPQPHTNLFEDPRLFLNENDLWVSFVAATFKNSHHFACQGIAKLNDKLGVERIFYPDAGHNRNDVCMGNGLMTREKNWTFFSYSGKIKVIYSINPLKIGDFNPDNGNISFHDQTMFDADWAWGNIHGGTGPIEVGGKLLFAFHSFDIENNQRRYHIGFYEVDPVKWRVTRISKSPWMSAKRDDSSDMRDPNQPYRPQVVFPCGIQLSGNRVQVSYGWNDCRSMLASEKLSDIISSLKEVNSYYEWRYKLRDPYAGLPGGFRCTVRGIEINAPHWISLVRKAKTHGIDEIELHDTICPRISEPYKTKQWHLIK